ncbi:aldehyde dehydrogenase family protein [Dyella choica]|uniref:Aldehyde dehydrogenase family protein n=2 Tax=Dyella choica TaxID=1927959 RepID=A0A432M8H9_9GAMM|nr:aldehyde dehydrogenase family protein [Dyella choica]
MPSPTSRASDMNTLEPVLVGGQWRASLDAQGSFRAEDPSRAEAIGPVFPVSGPADIEATMLAAIDAADALNAAPPARIADFLEGYAAAIDADADCLVTLAHQETALPIEPRLRSVELPRTSNQLRLAARAVRKYSWTEPVIDTQGGLRAHRASLNKPVLVYGPNNFPFAFNGIAGSDFASAIAARNPVIAKGHPSHPSTSKRLAQLAHEALLQAGLPPAAVQMLYRFDSQLGIAWAGDARLGAIGFTGSRWGGLALKAAADKAGVPMYAELSSINPVFLLPGALAECGVALAQEFFASCTMGSGQFCTNPGVLIVPRGEHGDAFVAAALQLFAEAEPKVLFSQGVQQGLAQAVHELLHAGAHLLTGGNAGDAYRFQPTLLEVDGEHFLTHAQALQAEAFGPASLIVRSTDAAAMPRIAAAFEGNLTGTIYRASNNSDDDAWHAIARVLRNKVGRLIANKMPTGVAVSAAMNHGGPYPSTSHGGFTAVGMPGAIRRFTALHSYDNVPDPLLPAELRDRNPGGVQRLVDGHWTDGDIHA